MKNAFEQVATC